MKGKVTGFSKLKKDVTYINIKRQTNLTVSWEEENFNPTDVKHSTSKYTQNTNLF